MGEIIKLPPPPGADMPLHRTIEERRSRRSYGSGGINLEQVSELLWASAGITSSRGFRAAPSAGATYPIDIYLLAENVEGLEPAIYRYIEESHALEPIKEGLFIEDLANAALRQSALKDASAVICLFGIYERTTRRYGERGKRYVHIEIGHIGQNIYLVAEALGLSTVAIGAFHDDRVSALFGVEGVPLYLMPVGPRRE
ncbi:nitroreductase [bacterium]|nr:MAG: nitroreductase [bacterium]